MSRRSVILILLAACSSGLQAREGGIDVRICDLVRAPEAFDGKMIRVRGPIAPNAVDAPMYADCDNQRPCSVVLSYPNELPPKERAFDLIRDADFEKFEDYLKAEPAEKPKPAGGLVSLFFPRRYCKITVTVTGRFEAVSEEAASIGRGFGHAGSRRFRLVVKSVANPLAEECPSK